jgi:hypothetical protein
MEWKLIRIDDAYEPPFQSFSLHETMDEALQAVRDHPRQGRIKNRIEGPNGLSMGHEEIVRWCRENPASIKQLRVPEMFRRATPTENSENQPESPQRDLFSGLASPSSHKDT